MAQFSLSPAVTVKEYDLSTTISNLPSSKTGMVLRANTGPCLGISSVTNENDLVTLFGKPTSENYMDWFNAWNFLQYASSLYVARPLPQITVNSVLQGVENAGAKVSGNDFANYKYSLMDIYNQTIAENTFALGSFASEKLFIFNKWITNTQKLGIAVCSSSSYWNSPICKDYFGAVALSAGSANVSAKTINLSANTTTTLESGSKFLTNDNKVYTVTGVTNNGSATPSIQVDNNITAAQLDTYYATAVSASGDTVSFSPTNFKLSVGALFLTGALSGNYVASIATVGGYQVATFAVSGTNAAPTISTFSGIVSTNASYRTGIVDSVSISGGNLIAGSSVKLQAGHTYIVGSNITLYTDGTFKILDIDTDTNVIYLSTPATAGVTNASTVTNGTVNTVDTALLPIISAFNKYDEKYDGSLILTSRITASIPDSLGVFSTDTIFTQSLVTFNSQFDFQPAWNTNNEFVMIVLEQNANGIYQIVEKQMVSYDSTGKDTTGKNIFAEKVFFNNSKYLYVKVGAGAKVNTATNTLITLGSDKTPDATAYTYAGILKADIQAAQDLFANAESFDVNLLLSHEMDINGFSQIAETRKDCVALVAPYSYTDYITKSASQASDLIIAQFGTNTVSTSKIFTAFGSYSAIYGNMKYQYDKFNDVNRWMSVHGDIAGLYANTDSTRDTWWAPAGVERGKIKNVIKLAFNPNKQNRDDEYINNINPILTITGEGTGIVFGQKTATPKPSAFDRVNVRRLLITIEKAIATSARYSMFEFNDSFTRARIKGMIDPYLRNIKGRRGLYDFLVICDSTNNDSTVIDANGLQIDIMLKPTKVAEFINISAYILSSGASFKEVVGQTS